MPRERSIISKLNNANYEPKRIHGLPSDQREMKLGLLVGAASGHFNTTNPVTGEVYEGIKGQFEYTDFDETRPVLISGKMFLPNGVDEMVNEALKSSEGAAVQFAFEVSVFRADNPAGYSWKLTPLMEATVNDPLAELRALADKRMNAPAQIEHKGEEKSEKGKK